MAEKKKATVVLGLQWGDEGKGKLVDQLAQDADLVARFAGGNNAGHTVVVDGVSYDFHLLPSGITNAKALNVIGNGVVVHLQGLFDEIDKNVAKGPHLTGWQERLVISDRAHVVLDLHQSVDGMRETQRGNDKIGTTRKGIGPTYSSKAARHGLRVCDLLGDQAALRAKLENVGALHKVMFPPLEFDIEAEMAKMASLQDRLKPLVRDTFVEMQTAWKGGKRILIEGANATMLDLDFGTYPYVTSSSCSIGGVCTGLGLPPQAIGEVYGVVKAYTTRVGDGAFPTEQLNDVGVHLQKKGHEVGTTTGRPRRCGWLDIPVVKYACDLNGVSSICLTKLDVLDELAEIQIGTTYRHNGEVLAAVPASQEVMKQMTVDYISLPGWQTDITAVRKWQDLPEQAKVYIAKIEELTGIPVKWVGVGPGRDATITKE